MNIKVKNVKNVQLEVKVKLSSNEIIDYTQLDRFQRAFIKGFLKPQAEKNTYIYTGPIGISLKERFQEPVTKKDFCYIIEQVVMAVQKLNANKFSVNNLVMNTDYIFFNDATKELHFLYVPTSNGFENCNLIELIVEIISSSKPNDQQDYAFLCRFANFFNNIKPFNLAKI